MKFAHATEVYSALAFDRLFKDEVGQGDKSVLDTDLVDGKSKAEV